MATLSEYLKHLREQEKPQPSPSEEIVEKSEAYDYLMGRGDQNE